MLVIKENIVSLLEECIGNFYDDFKTEGRNINFVSPNKCFLITNRDVLKRIIDNLIVNA